MSKIAREIILDELIENSHIEKVEDVIYWALEDYFKSKKYFIGSVKSRRFTDTSTSAYIFDYDMMEHSGILNLIRNKEEVFETESPSNTGKEELPF
jgi:hypothetical protein